MGGLLVLGAVRTYAIDLQPGDLQPLPAGTSFSQLSLRVSAFDGFYVDGQKQSDSFGWDAARYQIRLGHFFGLADMPAVAYVQTGLANIEPNDVMGPVSGDAGLEDTVALLAVWPYADHASQTYFGVGAYGLVPTGSYENDRGIINVGENRYWAALQAAFQTNLTQKLTLMTAVDGIWFGTNDDYTSDHLTLTQEALYTAQVGITYQITKALSVSASYFYTWGGETAIDGVEQDNANELHRYQLFAIAQLPVGRLMLQYGSDLERESGFFEDRRAILRFGQLF